MKPRPIVVGPWCSEVGFECLYWLPWLQHQFRKHRISPDRIYCITRGGAGGWYGLPEGHALDLYALRPVDDVRHATQEAFAKRGSLKQLSVTAFDKSVIDQACSRWGLVNPLIIHPSRMYRTFQRAWTQQETLNLVLERTMWEPIPRPKIPKGLPPKYYVAGFYARYTLTTHHETVRQVNQIVRGMAKHLPVILLRSPHHVDDHMDLPIEGDNIMTPDVAPPDETLLMYSALLSHSQGFVGTYGGLAQLALRFGIPSLSFYEHLEGTSMAHLYLSQWLSAQMKVPFVAQRLGDVPMLQRAMSEVKVSEIGRSS